MHRDAERKAVSVAYVVARASLVASAVAIAHASCGTAGPAPRPPTSAVAVAPATAPQPQGKIDAQSFASAVRTSSDLRGCGHEPSVTTYPSGEVTIRLTVTEFGVVNHPTVARSGGLPAVVEACLLRTLGAWQFPRPVGGPALLFVRITLYPVESGPDAGEWAILTRVDPESPAMIAPGPAHHQPCYSRERDPIRSSSYGASTPSGDPRDRQAIKQFITNHIDEVIACYEEQLTRQPTLAGRILMHFRITPSGDVARANVANSTVDHQPFEDCVGQRICTWRFVPPVTGGHVLVEYPFIFEPAKPGDKEAPPKQTRRTGGP